MYKMNPHSLDVTLRKVRMPSKHCRVLSMLIRYRRLSRKKKTYILGRFRKLHEDVRYIARNLLDSDTVRPVIRSSRTSSSNKRPSKRVSTSLCTLVARLSPKIMHKHCTYSIVRKLLRVRFTTYTLQDVCVSKSVSPRIVDKLAQKSV